jgi:hypothetical protein
LHHRASVTTLSTDERDVHRLRRLTLDIQHADGRIEWKKHRSDGVRSLCEDLPDMDLFVLKERKQLFAFSMWQP